MRWLELGGPPRGLRAVFLTCVSFTLTGCPSTEPDPVEVPPPVPGSECEPAAQRCVDEKPYSVQICRADGRGWFDKRCPTGSVCDPPTGTCQSEGAGCSPGASKCSGSPGTAARAVCGPEGNGWNDEPCTGDLVCDPGNGQCASPLCAPGESRCDGGPNDRDRSTCAADRLSYANTPCPEGSVCVATAGGSKCVSTICSPGQITCSDDATAALRCDASGTAFEVSEACDGDEACQAGACVPSDNPLGDVVRESGPSGELALSPGRYAMAVVDTDTTGDGWVPYPAALEGAISDPPASPATVPPKSADLPEPATGKMLLHAPVMGKGPTPPWPGPEPKDTQERVFHVPDYASGGTVVLARTAKLRASGQLVNLWEDQTTGAAGSLLPDAVLTDLLSRLDGAVMPRASAMMGELTDVDENGKVDILFTDVLPAEIAAFSYPSATLFPPGSYAVEYDFGEVIYAHGLASGQEAWEVATLMSHEVAQLTYLARRIEPFLPDPASVPPWVTADVYAVEGLASVAMGWSGQSWAWPAVAALENPLEMSLWRLTSPEYLQEPTANLAAYGYGTLIQEYLFDQAGAMTVQGSGAVLEDAGGLAYLQAFSAGDSGWDRLAPIDGRPLSEWYVDFATALMLLGIEGKVSSATASEERYQFAPTVPDPAFGGFIGPTLRYEHVLSATQTGPILSPQPWAQSPAEIRRGGISLVSFVVGDAGGTLCVTRPSTTAAIIRHLP